MKSKLSLSRYIKTGIPIINTDNKVLFVSTAQFDKNSGDLRVYFNKHSYCEAKTEELKKFLLDKLYENECIYEELKTIFSEMNIGGKFKYSDRELQSDKYMSFDIDKTFFVDFFMTLLRLSKNDN